MTFLGGLILAILALLVLCASRPAAAASLIAAVCYLTQGQTLDVAGINMTAVRIIFAVGFVRVIARGEFSRFRFNTVDRTLVMYALSIFVISTLRVGTLQEFIYRVGVLGDTLAAYLVFSSLLRDQQDLRQILAKAGWLIIPFALLMVFESFTGRNLFSALGGVYEVSWVRYGHVRSAAAFRNPISAGAFGAMFAMLFASTVFAWPRTGSALIGLVCSILIVICARSSGPLLGLVLGFLTLGCWRFRRNSRMIRWGMLVALVGLELVMKEPVWFLIERVGGVVGGNANHRAVLINQFVNYFSSWWLAGTIDTSNWFPYTLADGTADMTNRFVADGVDAGLVGLILSIALIVSCFQRVGAAMKAIRGVDQATERMLWGIGSTLVANVGILFSVTYFDQMYVIWYFLLACIARVDVPKNQPESSVARRFPKNAVYGVSRREGFHAPRAQRNGSLPTFYSQR